MSELPPRVAVRLLRAKCADLETQAKRYLTAGRDPSYGYLAADIALLAELLADHIERSLDESTLAAEGRR